MERAVEIWKKYNKLNGENFNKCEFETRMNFWQNLIFN